MPDRSGGSGEYVDFNNFVVSIDYEYYKDGRVASIHVQKLVGSDTPFTLYFLQYSYEPNGLQTSMTVKKDAGAKTFLYRARYGYDGRGQLTHQIYDYYDSGEKLVVLLSEISVGYDLAGNVIWRTQKNGPNDLWIYAFTYDTGYRMTSPFTITYEGSTTQVYTYILTYDRRGNLIAVDATPHGEPPCPIDLPDTMHYDAHNRMVEFSVGSGGTMKTWNLKYGPLGRVYRKEEYLGESSPVIQSATHYYYQGSALVQEYDEILTGEPLAPADAIEWDYLRGAGGVVRRRETDGETVTDTLHYNDMLGTIKDEGYPAVLAGLGTTNGYVTTAEGEPLAITGGQPTSENHIQFHGGFLEGKEWHTAADSGRGYLYRMGVRHYSPAFGRFLQREPLSYLGAPNSSSPLSVNPYAYGYNNPLMYTDTLGDQASCGGGVCPSGSPEGATEGGGGPTPHLYGGGDVGEKPDPKCEIIYPKNCWCVEDQPRCCKSVGGPTHDSMCNPCGSSAPTLVNCPPGNSEAQSRCFCWCCAMREGYGEENAPTPKADPSQGGGGWKYLGPPRCGPGGDGGDRWWFGPLPQLPSPVPMPPTYGDELLLSIHVSQHLLTGYRETPSPMVKIPWGIILIGAVGFVWGYYSCQSWDAAAKAFCAKKPNLRNPLEFEQHVYYKCLQDVCCAYNSCSTPLTLLAVGLLIAGFWWPPAWIGAKLAWTVGSWACTIIALKHAKMCDDNYNAALWNIYRTFPAFML